MRKPVPRRFLSLIVGPGASLHFRELTRHLLAPFDVILLLPVLQRAWGRLAYIVSRQIALVWSTYTHLTPSFELLTPGRTDLHRP